MGLPTVLGYGRNLASRLDHTQNLHQQVSNGSAANDKNACTRVGGRAPDGMDGDGCWLGEDGLLIAELGWDGD